MKNILYRCIINFIKICILCFRSKYYIEEVKIDYKVTMYLNIQNLDTNDLGTYICLATNSMGHANNSVRVHGKFNN